VSWFGYTVHHASVVFPGENKVRFHRVIFGSKAATGNRVWMVIILSKDGWLD
jgi:hypothetical protein